MKNFTDILNRIKVPSYGETLRPSRDWLVLFTLTLLLMLLSVAWNLWTFSEVTKGESIGTETPSQTGGSGTLDAAARIFEARKAEENRYRSEYRFVDPSGRGR